MPSVSPNLIKAQHKPNNVSRPVPLPANFIAANGEILTIVNGLAAYPGPGTAAGLPGGVVNIGADNTGGQNGAVKAYCEDRIIYAPNSGTHPVDSTMIQQKLYIADKYGTVSADAADGPQMCVLLEVGQTTIPGRPLKIQLL